MQTTSVEIFAFVFYFTLCLILEKAYSVLMNELFLGFAFRENVYASVE